jgi:ribose transport system substrate-binding protein
MLPTDPPDATVFIAVVLVVARHGSAEIVDSLRMNETKGSTVELEGTPPITAPGPRRAGWAAPHTVGRTALAAVVAVVALVSAACGSSSNSSSGGGTTAAPSESAGSAATTGGSTASSAAGGELDAAKATVDKYSTVPTAIVQTEPLKSKPPKKKVAFIVCSDPSCVALAGFLKDATTALSWDLTTINASPTDPGSAIQQAIDSGADYIAETGSDSAQFKTQMDELKSKKIPLFMCYATDVPAGESNGIYSDCYDSSAAKEYAKGLMDWVAVDGNGAANILAVTLPAFPILGAQVTAAKDALSQDCPGCTFNELDATVSDLTGGAVPQQIVSYLQTHPEINYVYLTYNGLGTGVTKAIEAAGLADKVKVVGTQAAQPQLQEIIDGKSPAWTALPQELSMWTIADQMARQAVGQWSAENERSSAVPPFYLVTSPDMAKQLVDLDYGWRGPEGFQDAFKQLWGV